MTYADSGGATSTSWLLSSLSAWPVRPGPSPFSFWGAGGKGRSLRRRSDMFTVVPALLAYLKLFQYCFTVIEILFSAPFKCRIQEAFVVVENFLFPGWLFWGVRRVAIAKLVPSSVFTSSFSRKVPKHTICSLFQSILEKVKLNREVIENGIF